MPAVAAWKNGSRSTAIRAIPEWTQSIGSNAFRLPRRATTSSACWRTSKSTACASAARAGTNRSKRRPISLHVSPAHQRFLCERNPDLLSRARFGPDQGSAIVRQIPRASHRVRGDRHYRDDNEPDQNKTRVIFACQIDHAIREALFQEFLQWQYIR